MSREYKGVDNIRRGWWEIPPTRHPDILTDMSKWLVETYSLPGVPDLSGQSLMGVGGLIVIVHGEFDEIDSKKGTAAAKRSFDRTFVLGPGNGLGGVRVLNDMMTLRAYGGSDAWAVEEQPAPPVPDINLTPADQTLSDSMLATKGTAPPISIYSQSKLPFIPEDTASQQGKTAEELQQEQLVMWMMKQTGMNMEYSMMCLKERNWNLQDAVAAFELVKVGFRLLCS